LTVNVHEFTLKNIMQLVRIQNRESKQIGKICRGALFCGYFSGISRSEGRPMTHSPANTMVDWRGG
jgi:hypothetical protein